MGLGQMVCFYCGGRMRVIIENIKTYEGVGYYIGRSTPLGNHFPLSMGRRECIDAYGLWLRYQIEYNKYNTTHRYFLFIKQELLLKGEVTLICHCTPLPCHGHEIGKLLMEDI